MRELLDNAAGPPNALPGGRSRADFEQFYRSQLLVMVRLAHVVTGSNTVAEDLVHNAFIKLAPRFTTLREPAPYLRATVLNECRMWYRRRNIERRQPVPDRPVALPPEVDTTLGILLRMPQRRRAALYMRFYEDMSIDDIALALDCRPGTVRSLISRGLASLREELGRDQQR